MVRRRVIGIVLVLAVVVFAAWTTADDPPQEPATANRGTTTLGNDDIVLANALQPFDACDDVLDYFKTNALEIVGPYGLPGSEFFFDGPVAIEDSADMSVERSAAAPAAPQAVAGAASSGSGAAGGEAPVAGKDFSGTNVQEAGVDEADIVKTDGRIIVTVAREKLQIIDLERPDEIAATLNLKGWDHELLLEGDRLLIMSGGEGAMVSDTLGKSSMPGYADAEVSRLTLVDLSDPRDPTVEATLTLDGAYRSARMVGGTARVVLSSQPTGLEFEYPTGGGLRAERRATRANREVIRESTIENWLPYYVLEDRRGGEPVASEGVLLECDGVSRPPEFSGLGMVSVLTVDLAGALVPEGGTAIVASGETVYASPQSLYVTTNHWVDPQIATDDERAPVEEDYTTEIHAFDITDTAEATYRASGSVRGHVLNQFSLSEHDGHLRVATTDGAPWAAEEGRGSESFVTVLEARNGSLEKIGQVGELGRGEQIHAVRFLGDVGYVVTFRQTDPLYTIDLSDPTAPRTTGELKILGYSAYLHPVSDGLLLGVGQDATKEGRTTGTQVSLFDVSDPAAPKRLAQRKIRGGSSEVEWDHRAFLYWPATRTAVIPVETYNYDERTDIEEFSAEARAFRVTPEEVAELGAVRHPPRGPDGEWGARIRRAIVVGDDLVTLSEDSLAVSDLDTLERRTVAPFR